MSGPRRLLAVLTGALLATSAGVVAALPATAAATSVALVGDLQEELGCPGDWQPDCAATELTLQKDGTTWSGTFGVPQGAWNFKVALNDSWTENYGAGDHAAVQQGHVLHGVQLGLGRSTRQAEAGCVRVGGDR